jgi:ElaB/YqjD/DUF883 family membrane-anchored ribosome-binding protein
MKNTQFSATNGDKPQQKLDDGADKASAATHQTIDSISENARPALDHLVSSAHVAVDRAATTATQAAAALGDKGDQLMDGGKRMLEQVEGYVREHPVTSLGLALATGYILSRLSTSR